MSVWERLSVTPCTKYHPNDIGLLAFGNNNVFFSRVNVLHVHVNH